MTHPLSHASRFPLFKGISHSKIFWSPTPLKFTLRESLCFQNGQKRIKNKLSNSSWRGSVDMGKRFQILFILSSVPPPLLRQSLAMQSPASPTLLKWWYNRQVSPSQARINSLYPWPVFMAQLWTCYLHFLHCWWICFSSYLVFLLKLYSSGNWRVDKRVFPAWKRNVGLIEYFNCSTNESWVKGLTIT
jgi:hypothetical protein